MGLAWSKADRAALDLAAADLRSQQRSDGGWSQHAAMPTDAYATGMALYAMYQAGVSPTDAAYQAGLRYLLRTQAADGTWHENASAADSTVLETGYPLITTSGFRPPAPRMPRWRSPPLSSRPGCFPIECEPVPVRVPVRGGASISGQTSYTHFAYIVSGLIRMPSVSDALVVFGVTGDLAYKKIFPALQSLVSRGQLKVPIIE